ncbi:MAG TPA: hypothetical protein VKR31_07100 [Rhizomicrobium sp.]|nr:hypothetical protein [Rhizomicrobium sp.]
MGRQIALQRYWNAFARTAIGDMVVTAIVIVLISSALVACALTVIGVAKGASFMFGHVG